MTKRQSIKNAKGYHRWKYKHRWPIVDVIIRLDVKPFQDGFEFVAGQVRKLVKALCPR